MVKEIQKEVADNIDRLIQKTRKLSVKLFSFVISFRWSNKRGKSNEDSMDR